jgi:hypothetical protein
MTELVICKARPPRIARGAHMGWPETIERGIAP